MPWDDLLSGESESTNQQTSKVNGLTTQEAAEKLAFFGYNESPERKENPWKISAARFWGIVPWMLEATAVITFVLGKYVQAIVVIALILFNAVMSQWREGRAKRAVAALKQRLTIQCRVKRDGKWSTVLSRELVPGDLVRVRIGDLVPADIRIVEGSLGLDQSILTGESGIVDRSAGELAYSGSATKRGEATGIVVATGAKTYFGKTISLLELAKPKLHMEEVTTKVARRLAVIVAVSLIVVFAYAVLIGFDLAILLPLAGVLLLATVPVAMPTMFTINMALGSLALSKQGVLVTRLSASEDAATMDLLCADKTGTITQNKLFVEEQIPLGEFSKQDVLLYGALASKEANQDPIDLAFLSAASSEKMSARSYLQLEFVPFDPKTRMTEATIWLTGVTFRVGKGSLDAICNICYVSQETAKSIQKLAERLSEKGLRVIAVAKGEDRDSLQFVGLAGLADRIREDSCETIEQIRNLGVEVKILTGDSLFVAKNVAEQIGLGKNVIALSREQKSGSRTAIYDQVAEDCCGVAQIYPEDKFGIVKKMQDTRHVVGMTGDGVNDAPALAQAEVGIAVKNATDIAKDSASVVLTTEGLSGIIPMIKTSRAIYQKVYSWTLMMVSRKLHIAIFIVALLFLTNSLLLSITSTLLLIFLADFATMTMATGNVRSSSKPQIFDLRTLFGTGLALGILMTVESTVFVILAFPYFGLTGDAGKIFTFGFAYLNFVGAFNLLSLRETSYFWKSKPSTILSIAIIIEILVVIAISAVGILELAPLGIMFLLIMFAFTMVTTLLLNDPIKVYLLRKLGKNNSAS